MSASPRSGLRFRVMPSPRIGGAVQVPGDKSVSHRALILGALARGTTCIGGFLDAADTRATLAAVQALGAAIETGPDASGGLRLQVEGCGGRGGLRPPGRTLDLGNSGTGLRLLAGVLAGQPFASELTGDASLRSRPMARITEPLRRMGARIEAAPGERAPLRIRGPAGGRLQPIDYTLPVASAQVKSCILLAGLHAPGWTTVRENAVSRDHTERMLEAFGAGIERRPGVVRIRGGGRLEGTAVEVPGDISSAAFFLVAGAIASGIEGRLVLPGVGLNPTRTGVLTILERMGADVRVENRRTVGGEPIGDLAVRPAPLHGVDIGPELVPLAIDELPVLMVAAAFASGRTRLHGAGELRVKESDRVATTASGLRALGVRVEEHADGMTVQGGPVGGGRVDAKGDHRIAMAFAVAAVGAAGPVLIDHCDNVATSFPSFAREARSVGIDLREEQGGEREGADGGDEDTGPGGEASPP